MEFILGEKKEVKIRITSTTNDPFAIQSASYELLKRGGTIVDEGQCEIHENILRALIQPKESGSFILYFTYSIANEILKSDVSIEVNSV
jgi:hypothetical protein